MVNNKELEPIGGTISVVNLPVAMLTASNMPMRDCIAMAAMQALIQVPGRCNRPAHEITNDAFQYADSFLKSREPW